MPIDTASHDNPLIVQYDNDLNIISANDAALSFVSKEKSEILGMSCHQFWGHPPDHACQQCPLLQNIEEKDEYSSLIQLRPGENLWHVLVSQLHLPSGQPFGKIAIYNEAQVFEPQGTSKSITTAHASNVGPNHAFFLYHHLFKESPVMIIRIHHHDGVILDANRAFLTFCGLSLNEVLGKHPTEIGIWPNAREEWDKLARQFDQDLVLQDLQVPLTDKEGLMHQVVLSISFDNWGEVPSALAIGLDITEAHRLQEELIITQQNMKNAFEAIQEGYFDIDLGNNHILANDNCYRLLGYSANELPVTFTNWLYSIHPDDRKWAVQRLHTLRTGKIEQDSFRIRMLKKNGEILHVFHQHKVAKYDPSGTPTRVIGTITDLTEQIKVEQALKTQKETLEATFNAIDEGIWEYNIPGNQITINERCKELTGFLDIGEINAEHIDYLLTQAIHPEDVEQFLHTFQQIQQGEISTLNQEIRLSNDGKNWHWYNIRGGVSETDENNRPVHIVGALAEITERKELNRRLRLLEAGIEQSSMMAFLFRPDGSIQYVNQYAIDEMGYSQDEFCHLKVFDLDPDFSALENKEEVWQMNKHRIKETLSQTLDVTFIRKDRTTFPVMVDFRFVDFENEQYYWTLAKDISELKAAQQSLLAERESLARRVEERTQELAATNEFLDLIIKNLPIPVYFIDENCQYIDANQAFAEFFGYQRKEVIGKSAYDMVRKEIADSIMEDDKVILQTRGRIHKLGKLSNGADELRDTVLMKKGFVHPKTGQRAIVGTFIDITDRIKLQNQLEQSNQELNQALRVKDEFLANMSHELRTPLTSIIGYSELLLAGMGGKLAESQEKYLDHILFAGKHLLTLINDILDYSKINAEITELNREMVRVRSICIAALSIMEPRAFKKDIQIEFDFDEQVDELYCDPQRLRQILINLMSNAIKFSHNYGTIGLRVKKLVEPKPAIEFQIWDQGIGIEDKDKERIFEPFTQVASHLERNYEGSGIGLSLVKKFVDLHNGQIQVESSLGQGSVFTIHIPIEEEVG